MRVIEYVTEEVERQGHDTTALDGIQRTCWMLRAWCFAIPESGRSPTISDLLIIGKLIEPDKNAPGLRRCNVRVGRKIMPPPEQLESLLFNLFSRISATDPLDFYRGLLEIHPFQDGNGRSGKVMLNWMAGTLERPIFPPDDFWGSRIRNP